MSKKSSKIKTVLPGIYVLFFLVSWRLVLSRIQNQAPDPSKFSLREQFRFVQEHKTDFNKTPLQLLRREILKTLPTPHNTDTNIVLVWTTAFRPHQTNEPRHWELMVPARGALYVIHSNGFPVTPLCDADLVHPLEALERFAGMTRPQAEAFLDQAGLSKDTPLDLIQKMRNYDIRWNDNCFGLSARPTGPVRKLINQSAETVVPLLIVALKDKDRYVAAHVALTEMRLNSYAITATAWNELSVEVVADGQTVIPDQQDAILYYWTKTIGERTKEK